MTVSFVVARFATVWGNFSTDADGAHIETAFPRMPRNLIPAHLPAVITSPSRATHDYETWGSGARLETRRYRCVVVIQLALSGNDEIGEVGVETYLDKVPDYFAARPGLKDDSASEPQNRVHLAQLVEDGGYILFEYPSGSQLKLFHAAEFFFDVQEINQITYKD